MDFFNTVWRCFSPRTAPPAFAQRFERLLRDEPDQFVDVLQRDAAVGRRLARRHAGRFEAMLQYAERHDLPAAYAALIDAGVARPTARTRMGPVQRPAFAAYAVERARASAAAVVEAATTLPEELLRIWLAEGRLSLQAYCEATQATPETVGQLVEQGVVTAEAFLQHYDGQAGALTSAHRLSQTGFVSLVAVMQHIPHTAADAIAWAVAGEVTVREVFKRHQPFAAAQAQQLCDAGVLDDETWLRSGHAPRSLIERRVADGSWRPEFCLRTGWVPEDLAARWLRRGIVSQNRWEASALQHWHPEVPLPSFAVKSARLFCRDRESVLAVRLAGAPGSAVRQTYAAQLLLAAFQPEALAGPRTCSTGARAGPYRWVGTLLAQLNMVDRAAAVHAGAPGTGSCCVCFEACCEPVAPVRLAACRHPATMGLPCMQQALRTNLHRCPYPNCDAPVTVADAVRLRLGPQCVMRLSRAEAQRTLREQSNWWSCPTDGCVGGKRRRARPERLTCTVCECTHLFGGSILLNAANRPLVRLLIRDMQDFDWSGPIRRTRVCYGCGTPSTHLGGCPTMVCTVVSCRTSWHFITGSFFGGVDTRRQTYVPRAGFLVELGLFHGLEPGSTGVENLLTVVEANARKLGVYHRDPGEPEYIENQDGMSF